MNANMIVMTCVCALCALVFIIRRCFKRDVVSLLLKTLASICFVILGFCGCLYADNFKSAGIVIIGLMFGMLGDIFLDLKFVDAANSAAYTASGFASFIFGHLFYIIFILNRDPQYMYGKIAALVIAVLVGVFIYASPKLLKLDFGNYRLISAIYAGILVFVTVYAGIRAFSIPSAFSILFFIGLVCFLISDLILCQIYFGQNRDTKVMGVLNHTLYYAAQILIASSIFYV